MRGAFIAGAVVVVTLSCISCMGSVSVNKSAPPPQPSEPPAGTTTLNAPDEPAGLVRAVETLEDERPNPALRYAVVRISYENDTDRTLASVQIWCRALDDEGWALGAQSWALSSSFVGPIEPGFRMRRKMSIQVPVDAVVGRIDCRVTGAN